MLARASAATVSDRAPRGRAAKRQRRGRLRMATAEPTTRPMDPEHAIVWEPSPPYLERSRLRRFIARHRLDDYDHLLRRAAEDPSWYWDAVVHDLDLVWSRPYD